MQDESETGEKLIKLVGIGLASVFVSGSVSAAVGRRYGYRIRPQHAWVMGLVGGLAGSIVALTAKQAMNVED